MPTYFVISTLLFPAALLILFWLHRQSWLEITTPHVPPPPAGPLISLIIPARNEQNNIRRSVEAALAQDYPNFEAALFMPAWPLLGLLWLQNGGGIWAELVTVEALLVWAALITARARVNLEMGIAPAYALLTPLGAGVFAAMMFASAWKVLSGQGVTWKGRRYL